MKVEAFQEQRIISLKRIYNCSVVNVFSKVLRTVDFDSTKSRCAKEFAILKLEL